MRLPHSIRAAALFATAAMLAVGLFTTAAQAGEAQDLVDKAELTVNAFRVDPDMGSMRELMRRAEGVLIIPQVLKAGFFIGGEGGTGVLMTR